MTQIPELHPSEAFALGFSWGSYCSYRDEFGNKQVRYLPYLISAFKSFAGQPPSHREIPLAASDFPAEGLEWQHFNVFIYTFEVAYCLQDSRTAYVRYLEQPLVGVLLNNGKRGAQRQSGKYIFQDDQTQLRRQLLDYFSPIADVRSPDYRFFHRNIRDVVSDPVLFTAPESE